MWKIIIALIVLAILTWTHPGIASFIMPSPSDDDKVVVGKEGLVLYPRINKSLRPLAELSEGQTVIILRQLKAWKQVQVEGSDLKGWIAGDIKKTQSLDGRKFDTVVSPTTTGLVARGWSKGYAAHCGADFSRVEAITIRTLDPDRYDKFLAGEVNQ